MLEPGKASSWFRVWSQGSSQGWSQGKQIHTEYDQEGLVGRFFDCWTACRQVEEA